jgi:threonine dehydrogenase-like Zn-dependent dehydrogenase
LRRPKRAELGNDLTGRVEAVGRDVEEFRPGDEVFGTGLGAWAEYAVARRSHLVRKPAGVSFEAAAAVPVAALTALQAVRDVTAVCSTSNVDLVRSLGADRVVATHKTTSPGFVSVTTRCTTLPVAARSASSGGS